MAYEYEGKLLDYASGSKTYEASNYIGAQQSNVVKNLKGIRNRVKNYNFEYTDEQESDIYLKIKSILRKC